MKIILIAALCLMAGSSFAQAVLTAVSSFAQAGGLPIADTADTPKGLIMGSGGAVFGNNGNRYGGRVTFAATEGLGLFGDVGMIDPDEGDSALYLQGGGKWQLPIEKKKMPLDLALRGTLSWFPVRDEQTFLGIHAKADGNSVDFNGGLLGSFKVNKPLAVYGYLGLNIERTTIDTEFTGTTRKDSDTDTQTDPAIAGGVIVNVARNFSLYGEIAHIDDLFFALGARVAFK